MVTKDIVRLLEENNKILEFFKCGGTKPMGGEQWPNTECIYEQIEDNRRTIEYIETITQLTNFFISVPPYKGSTPPPHKKDWEHSEQVLVYYSGGEHEIDSWGIAYYHYCPPFENKPKWIDFDNPNKFPLYWWPLPEIKK